MDIYFSDYFKVSPDAIDKTAKGVVPVFRNQAELAWLLRRRPSSMETLASNFLISSVD
jgi:hypothetical protein